MYKVWSVESEVEWSAKCKVWGVKCEVWSRECKVQSVKCKVWSGDCEWTVQSRTVLGGKL